MKKSLARFCRPQQAILKRDRGSGARGFWRKWLMAVIWLADKNAKNAKRQTPLHRTALSIRWVESMHLLLDARASARIEDWNGQTPFDLIKGDTAWIQEYATYKRLKAASGE
jgi:hypothetical protein